MRKVAEENAVDGKSLSSKVAAMASPEVVGKKLEEIFNAIIGQN